MAAVSFSVRRMNNNGVSCGIVNEPIIMKEERKKEKK
jgi:hypothetical protein